MYEFIRSDESVTFRAPKKKIQDPIVKPSNLSYRLLHENSIRNIDLIFQKKFTFEEDIKEKILNNFQKTCNQDFKYFLHLIVLPPSNVDEKIIYFNNKKLISQKESTNYPFHICIVPKLAKIQDYINHLLGVKNDLKKEEIVKNTKVLFVFNETITYSSEDFERLIILINEEIVIS